MRCEVCGRKIHGKPYKVIIEGAKLTVCNDCSKHGKTTWEEEPKTKVEVISKRPKLALKVPSRTVPETLPDATLELIEDFDVRIRQAREGLGLSHEELGRKINEKTSLLRKIETRKMTPDNLLATKLEHTLKIRLIVPRAEEKIKIPAKEKARASSRELTLGDLIQMEKQVKKGKEDTAERGLS